MTTAFPGTTFTPAPGSEPRNKQENRDMFVTWAHISKLGFFDGLYENPTMIMHPDHTEYRHNQIQCVHNAPACGPLRVYSTHAEMDIHDATKGCSDNDRTYSGTIRYELNNEFYEALGKIEWKVSEPARKSKVANVIQQMVPVAGITRLPVGSVLLARRGQSHDNDDGCVGHAIVLGMTGFLGFDGYVECIGLEDLHPGHVEGTCYSQNPTRGSGVCYTWGNTFADIHTLLHHYRFYLVQEGTGKTWAEYGPIRDPYVPRDVLSRARATKNLVDDYLRGVGIPRNNRRVEQMLGIGY